MRKCVRCGVEMSENIATDITIKRPLTYKTPEVTLKAAFCPECGFTELYSDELGKNERPAINLKTMEK